MKKIILISVVALALLACDESVNKTVTSSLSSSSVDELSISSSSVTASVSSSSISDDVVTYACEDWGDEGADPSCIFEYCEGSDGKEYLKLDDTTYTCDTLINTKAECEAISEEAYDRYQECLGYTMITLDDGQVCIDETQYYIKEFEVENPSTSCESKKCGPDENVEYLSSVITNGKYTDCTLEENEAYCNGERLIDFMDCLGVDRDSYSIE